MFTTVLLIEKTLSNADLELITTLHGDEKAVAAGRLVTKLGASLADCWAYSDSRNDIPLLTMVGHRVVVNPDSRLAAHARSLKWPILQLKRASIKEAQKRVRREAKASRAKPPRTGLLKKKAPGPEA